MSQISRPAMQRSCKITESCQPIQDDNSPQFYQTKPVYDEYHTIRNQRKKAKFHDPHESELSINEAAVNQITKLRKSLDINKPTIHELKKEKAALLREQERLNTQRKALKESYKGLSEGYRAIEEQTRQQQRQRARHSVKLCVSDIRPNQR